MALLAPSHQKTYRRDINGLRAWAVIAVVFYHFGVPGFQGGFAGVDVFFVISGFLMTGIIVDALDSDAGFSFTRFFIARARRTVPALAVLCAVLLALGWFLLPATDYRQLGQHALAAISFLSNMKFWREIGYFDIASQEKWLLHTWSLSVEWQFYLVLPVALSLVWHWRRSRRTLTLALGLAAAGSVLLGLAVAPYPGAAFYLLPMRAWEMLAGGLVFMLGNVALSERQRRTLELLGFALLAVTFVAIDGDAPWPGWRAMIPVAGSALILMAARPDSAWTGSAPAQWLGAASYSIYLWHWPLVVALRQLDLRDDRGALLRALAATAVLGQLSWTLIEQPARRHFLPLRLGGGAAFALIVAAVAVPAWYVLRHAGVPGRLPPNVDLVFAEADNRHPRYKECYSNAANKAVFECRYGGRVPGAIVIGDSHAQAIMRTVEKALPRTEQHVVDWSMSGCPTLAGVKTTYGRNNTFCGLYVAGKTTHQDGIPPDVPMIVMNRLSAYAFSVRRSDEREQTVPSVYFDAVYPAQTPAFKQAFREHIIATACAFSGTRPVFLMRPVPEMPRNVPRTMGIALLRGHAERVSVSLAEYHARNKFVWEAQDAAQARCGVAILDPLPYLCDSARCYGDQGGMPLYIDDHHLSERGAQRLLPLFRAALRHGDGA